MSHKISPFSMPFPVCYILLVPLHGYCGLKSLRIMYVDSLSSQRCSAMCIDAYAFNQNRQGVYICLEYRAVEVV